MPLSGPTPSSDFPGLVTGIPSAALLAQVGAANANIIGLTLRHGLAIGQSLFTLPKATFVVGAQTTPGYAGRPALYLSGRAGVFVDLNGAAMFCAGTDRTNVAGLAQWENCPGVNGFIGAGTIDFVNPQFAQGVVSKVIDSTHFVVTLDYPIAWSDFYQALVYDPVLRRYLSRPITGTVVNAQTACVPITLATGTNQVTGSDYLVDCSGSEVSFVDMTQIAVGVELVFAHFPGANLVSAVNTDKFVMPKGLRILGAANAVFYGPNCSLDFDATVEPALITSAIASRGRVRRRMCAGGGLLFTPSEYPSSIGGTIMAVGDDAVDFTTYVTGVVSRDSATQLTVQLRGNYACMPTAGQTVTLTDANRDPQFVGTLASVAENVSAGTAALTFAPGTALPAAITNAWEMESAENRRVVVKDDCRIELTASAGIRGSAREIRVGNCFIGETMGPALMFSDVAANEFAPASLISIGDVTLRNPQAGQGYERFAAVTIRPRLQDGQTLAGAGAFGDVDIASLTVEGMSNGPALAVGATASLRLGRLRARNLNQAPTAFGSLPTGASVQLENLTHAVIDALDEYGTLASVINCAAVGTLILGEACKVAVPASGVTNLLAAGKYVDWTPTFTDSAGATVVASVRNCRVSCDLNGRVHAYGAFGITSVTAASGGSTGDIVMTLPYPVGPKGWIDGICNNEQNRVLGAITASPNATTALVYTNNNGSSDSAGTVWFFNIEYETSLSLN